MDPINEPLLSSPSQRNCSPSKVRLGTPTFLATLLCFCFAAFLLLNPARVHLCTNSPDPASCHAIVADAVLTSPGAHPSRPARVLRAILARSLHQHDAAAAAVAGMHGRASDPRQRAALADCVQLMELARDRLADAADHTTATPEDARTWLSAMLTDHVTCLDGLNNGPPRDAVGAQLEPLMSLASASLAVLNAVGSCTAADDIARDVLAEAAADELPSWVPSADRALLEGSGAVQADVVVAKDGSGKYNTVQAAVDAAPDRGKRRYVIYVKKGVYKENLAVWKKKRELMIVGDGMDATVITGSRNVVDGATTFNSATLAVAADGVILQDLRIDNTAGPEKHQAVALRVSADRAVINRCRVDGYQDTLYAHQLRQFYRDCFVSGTVDFVFGNAAAVLQNCVITTRRPARGQKNAVTAQGRTDPNQNTGTSLHRCRVVPADDLAPVAEAFPTFLGRPWKVYSRTVYMQSYLGAHIHPRGWLEWNGDFALNRLFYGEYANEGPGAGTAGRVKWPGYRVITDQSVAVQFTVGQFIQGGYWLKGTGVAYDDGL
ncbi:pectinesterase-like [Triticum dicoccoides]|uniref:pectinesterase-like n=1 Tax=Triticum dicoccoides TaxID=85692 RepID=UPI000E78FF1B|nr:pectinesterase-like [Triticum dicoccoides]